MASSFHLDFEELTKIDGIPKDNLTFRINIDDLTVDWDDELGSGSFAQVFRGWYLWTEVAVKKMILPIQEQDMVLMKYFKREVVLLNLVKHPNIVQFLGWCHPEDSNYLLIVEEFIKGGTLQNFINKRASRDMWGVKIQLCMDVAKAMLYLHKNSVVYRDLKCDNILIDDGVKPRFAKLVDFGFARTLEMEHQRKGPPLTICGTDDWMAPEVILGMDYDAGSDVFSFGVVLLECILGTENVKNKLARKAFNCFQLDTELARSLTPVTCPEELLELTLSCCSYEPSARPDFHEVITILTNIHRRLGLGDTSAALSDVSTTDTSPSTSRVIGPVDLSQLLPSDDESSSGPPSAKSGGGSRDSTGTANNSPKLIPESPAIPIPSSTPPYSSSLPASPISSSPFSKGGQITARRADGQRNSGGADGAADDEADDLRRRISQEKLAGVPTKSLSQSSISLPKSDMGSPRQVSFANLGSSRDDQQSSPNLLSMSGYLENREKKEYIRVESLVDAFTSWNVRIGPGATVAAVCENIAKKIDAKYKFIELYQLHKRKRVLLFPEQFVDQVRAHWGGDQDYKFGVMYRTREAGNDFRPASTSGRRGSISKTSTVKSKDNTVSSKKTAKKKTIAMNVNFSMNPV